MEKNTNSRYFLLGILFVVAIVAYVLSMQKGVVEIVETKSEDDFVKITIQIPKLKNTRDIDLENQFNNMIQDKVKAIVEDVKSMAQEAANDDMLHAKYEVHISTEVKYQSRDFVSLVMYYYTFTGGAHGNTIIETYNLDLSTNKIITLKDIFNSNCDYETIIKEEILKQIEERMTDFFEESIEYVKNENISERTFTISKDGLEIYYQDYEIAPHSSGLPVFKIDITKIRNCLKYNLK